MDFTGVDAGTLSFDWSVIFNGAGGRNSSLKVYATTDGVNFTNVTAAFVTNFTNNISADMICYFKIQSFVLPLCPAG